MVKSDWKVYEKSNNGKYTMYRTKDGYVIYSHVSKAVVRSGEELSDVHECFNELYKW